MKPWSRAWYGHNSRWPCDWRPWSPSGSVPCRCVFAVAPKLASARPFGVALPWLLLGVAAFPFLFIVGWVYVHLAERNERDFVDVVGKH